MGCLYNAVLVCLFLIWYENGYVNEEGKVYVFNYKWNLREKNFLDFTAGFWKQNRIGFSLEWRLKLLLLAYEGLKVFSGFQGTH